jgi:outer membrane usher protein
MNLLLILFTLFAWAAPPPTLVAPLFVGEENLGDVWLAGKPGAWEAQTSSLLPLLQKALTPVKMEELAPLLRKSSVPLALLPVRFDEASLALQLEVDQKFLARKRINLGRGETETREAIGPSSFSGYVNLNGNQSVTYPRSKIRSPFRGNVNSAVNWNNTVLESGAYFTEKENYQWRRDDTRLVRDFESRLVRVTAGDLSVLTSGYQSSRPLGGVALTRQFSIQPYLNVRPLNRTEVTLKTPSTIEVYVNDGFVNRISAPAGPLELADFPLFSGINKVDLKIIDGSGNVEWVNLNLLYDAQLLGAGIQQFGYHVGAPWENFKGDRRYDEGNITSSVFHRWGVSDRFTVGGSFQNDNNGWLGGGEFVFLNRGGLVSGDAGLSHRSGARRSAGAGRLRYRSLDYKLGSDRPLRGALEVEYKEKLFAAVGQTGSVNDFSWRYDLSVSRPLTPVTTISLGGQYGVNRVGGKDFRSARADLTSEPFEQWRFSASYAVEKESRLGHRFQIVISWLDVGGRYYGNATYEYPSKTARVEMSRNPSTVVDDLRATLGAQNSPSGAQADAMLEYTHEKGNLRLDHQSARLREAAGSRRTTHTSGLGASTAIAWTGGAVGWTRPIYDSFALVKAKPLFRQFSIPVNPNGAHAEAHVNRAGPAVVPTLTSYNYAPVTLSTKNLPMGYSLGREYYLVRPTYRSGIRLDVGGESAASVTAQLFEPSGTALSLATGQIRQNGQVIATFFTNRSGNLLLENLAPGDYELTVDQRDFRAHKFSLRQEIGLERLGKIQLERGQ